MFLVSRQSPAFHNFTRRAWCNDVDGAPKTDKDCLETFEQWIIAMPWYGEEDSVAYQIYRLVKAFMLVNNSVQSLFKGARAKERLKQMEKLVALLNHVDEMEKRLKDIEFEYDKPNNNFKT